MTCGRPRIARNMALDTGWYERRNAGGERPALNGRGIMNARECPTRDCQGGTMKGRQSSDLDCLSKDIFSCCDAPLACVRHR